MGGGSELLWQWVVWVLGLSLGLNLNCSAVVMGGAIGLLYS